MTEADINPLGMPATVTPMPPTKANPTMETQPLAAPTRHEQLSLTNKLLHQLWTLCNEPSYGEQKEYFVLFANGELVRVQSGEPAAFETLAPADDWFVQSLPPAPSILNRQQNVGAIVADVSIALRLRNLTSHVFKEIAR